MFIYRLYVCLRLRECISTAQDELPFEKAFDCAVPEFIQAAEARRVGSPVAFGLVWAGLYGWHFAHLVWLLLCKGIVVCLRLSALGCVVIVFGWFLQSGCHGWVTHSSMGVKTSPRPSCSCSVAELSAADMVID